MTDTDPTFGSDLSPFPPGKEPECPTCNAPLVKKVGASRRTLMAGSGPGYDESGEYHNHNPNWNISTYECENGHKVRRSTRSSCPAPDCDYGDEVRMEVIND
jgi:hypothetical protein